MAFIPMPPARRFWPKMSGACSNQLRARQPSTHPRTLDKETMDPARPNDPDPSDPFNPERADHAILETIEIATEGEDCDECVRKLGPVLKTIPGVQSGKSISSTSA